MRKLNFIVRTLLVILLASVAASAFAAQLKGSVSVKRNNSRQIIGACLHVGQQEYEIVLDENGKSLAEMYEHKDLKVDCSVNGNKITVETWEEIRTPSAPEPAYKEPEPQPEPEEEPEEEPADEDSQDDEPKDEDADEDRPKDEKSEDEEPQDDEEKEESED